MYGKHEHNILFIVLNIKPYDPFDISNYIIFSHLVEHSAFLVQTFRYIIEWIVNEPMNLYEYSRGIWYLKNI